MMEIKQRFTGKTDSVKLDLCTRRKRRFIGILHAMVDGNLRVITARVNELHERATAATICKNILSFLAKVGILEKQIYSLFVCLWLPFLFLGMEVRHERQFRFMPSTY